jgi:hypothetical protein
VTVWVLLRAWDYEGDELAGVYSCPEWAHAARASQDQAEGDIAWATRGGWRIVPVEVDAAPLPAGAELPGEVV